MQYMLLIHNDEQEWAALGDEERNAIIGEYFEFGDSIRDQRLQGAPLEPSSATTVVRVRSGETLVTDGPFAETKEQLGGFYLIEADTLDEALEIAARVPGAKYGAIEVRPVAQVPARQP
jgi:hypothetical protein